MTEGAVIAAATPGDAGAIADLHGTLFDPAWDATSIDRLMAPPAGLALVARRMEGIGLPVAGFVLARVAADEAEILSLAVAPAERRRGLARRLLDTAMRTLAARGATRLFLEVAADNGAALALYGGLAFREVGRRRQYYRRRDGAAADAIVLSRSL